MQKLKFILIAVFLFCLGATMLQAQTVKDVDGNVYKTLTIGNQTWFAENLKTTKFRNGDLIKTTLSPRQDIRNDFQPNYQWSFNGIEKNADIYGRLYTWYAITDDRGVCPVGWHVSTDAEWSALITFLGGEIIAYTKLREADNEHWLKYDSGTNESGFTALPGGLRNSNGSFEDIGLSGNWWTSTGYDNSSAWYRRMDCNLSSVFRYLYRKRNGLSVRCVKTID